MFRRTVLRAGATAGAVAGCLGGSEDAAFREGFEDGIGEWEAGAAIGPEVDLADFEWELEVSGAEAAAGDRSLRIWNEGDYDDRVTWGVHPVPVEAGRAYRATVSAQFWSESESFNTIRDAVMRLGPDPPATEEAFPHSEVNTTDLGETACGGPGDRSGSPRGGGSTASSERRRNSTPTPSTSQRERASSGRATRPTT